jgi:RimJ/RimL family protein N-acetyltransferase
VNPLSLQLPGRIETERLVLTPPRPRDGAEVNHAIRECFAELQPWLPWAKTLPSVEDTEIFCRDGAQAWEKREHFPLLIRTRDTHTFIGGIGIPRLDWSVPLFEIGYWIHTQHTGRGYATEAVKALTSFAKHTLKARRLEIRCDARNLASTRVAGRAGFQHEATLRQDARDNAGQLRDTKIFSKVI